jgi:hypothetical protein
VISIAVILDEPDHPRILGLTQRVATSVSRFTST